MDKRIAGVYKKSETIVFDDSKKIVLMSDCHRGDGSWADTFSKNKNIYYAALKAYSDNGYTYIEIGDGDELWEYRSIDSIINVHKDVFLLLRRLYCAGRMYMIFGNHDMVKQKRKFNGKNLYYYRDERTGRYVPLFQGITVHEGLVLKHRETGKEIFLIHGHQADFLNSRLWLIARFLVRYFWKPLETFGVNDPTSTAKNYKKKAKVEKILSQYALRTGRIIVAGHTHRPAFPDPGKPGYFNAGSCVHPQSVTAIEIKNGAISLVKWVVKTTNGGVLYIGREVIAGPRKLG